MTSSMDGRVPSQQRHVLDNETPKHIEQFKQWKAKQNQQKRQRKLQTHMK
jgi:hypothetical protein